MVSKGQLVGAARRIHQGLLWFALLAVIAFVVSAFCHPMMAWTGPQAEQRFPPRTTISSAMLQPFIEFLNHYQGEDIRVAKVVPSARGPLLQVTHEPSQPRQYFTLDPRPQLLEDYDRQQAIWLARYYSGSDAAIKSVQFVTEFSVQFPWVNRLLPVYKVVLDTDDELTLFIHTETNALAAINNNWKKNLQTIFQWFHTWSWLDGLPILRIILVGLLLAVLLTATLSGVVMLFSLKAHRKRGISTYVHRKLAWWVFVPFLGLLVSGLYHLFQSEYGDLPSGMRLNNSFSNTSQSLKYPDNIEPLIETSINSLSLISHREQLFLRASVAVDRPAKKRQGMAQRNNRFVGQSIERQALLFSLNTGEYMTATGKRLAIEKAADHLNVSDSEILSAKRLIRFGRNYDFRNKRLPVWLLTSKQGDVLAIDPETGIVIEHTRPAQLAERWSFSMLHKWNMLVPFLGREGRDIVVVAFLALLLLLSSLGFMMRRKSLS